MPLHTGSYLGLRQKYRGSNEATAQQIGKQIGLPGSLLGDEDRSRCERDGFRRSDATDALCGMGGSRSKSVSSSRGGRGGNFSWAAGGGNGLLGRP